MGTPSTWQEFDLSLLPVRSFWRFNLYHLNNRRALIKIEKEGKEIGIHIFNALIAAGICGHIDTSDKRFDEAIRVHSTASKV